jgi:hypothetical protein
MNILPSSPEKSARLESDELLQKVLKVASENATASFNMMLLKTGQKDMKAAEKYQYKDISRWGPSPW